MLSVLSRLWPWIALALVLVGALAGWIASRRDAEPVAQLGSEFLSTSAVASHEHKPLLVVFSHPSAALARAMDDTLATLPVADYLRAHYVTLRLDSIVEAERFRRWLGVAGLLGSCVLDVEAPDQPQLLATAAGYTDPAEYLQFLAKVSTHLREVRRLRQLAPMSDRARLELGEIYQTQGNPAGARALFVSVTSPAPVYAQALEHLTRVNVEMGHIAEARQTLLRARMLQVGPSSERFVLTEAMVLSAERHVTAAIVELEQGLPAVSTPSELGPCLLLLADLDHELGRNAQALEQLRRVRALGVATSWARAADDRIAHILNPEPGHTH